MFKEELFPTDKDAEIEKVKQEIAGLQAELDAEPDTGKFANEDAGNRAAAEEELARAQARLAELEGGDTKRAA